MLNFAVSAQDFEARIKVFPNSSKIQIEGKLLNKNQTKPIKNWAFVRFSGAESEDERVSDLELKDKSGEQVIYKKLIAGEYLASGEAAEFSYKIDTKPAQNFTLKAHNSWLEGEQGSLMLRDLLPQLFHGNNQPFSAKIYLDLPENWKIIGSEKNSGDEFFVVENFENTVFVVGKSWREKKARLDNFELNIALFGNWHFSDDEAVKMAKDILENYKKTFAGFPKNKVQIFLVPLENKFGRWEAETRGSTLTIVSGDMPFETQSLQRLHEQLRHELFHLWIPNDLALTGNYAWFYEGFTVYQSLKTAIAANRIRFEDFLFTIEQAYNFANFSDEQVSLIELSKNNFNVINSQVYSKGMLVAFLCDTAILRETKGKNSISEIFREIYQKHKIPNETEDANTAILEILKNRKELRPIVQKYIEGAEKIEWQTNLESIGIEAKTENSFTKLRVKSKLNGRQKDLLNELGYNNWRKTQKKLK